MHSIQYRPQIDCNKYEANEGAAAFGCRCSFSGWRVWSIVAYTVGCTWLIYSLCMAHTWPMYDLYGSNSMYAKFNIFFGT